MKPVKYAARAIKSHNSTDPKLLSFKKGDIIVDVVKSSGVWWSGVRASSNHEDEEPARKQFPPSFVEELEDSPFASFEGNGTWDLGISETKLKPAKDELLLKNGIKHCIRFKYADGTKQLLGVPSSKQIASQWVDLINQVIRKDVKRKKSQEAEKYNVAEEFSNLIVYCASMNKNIVPEDYNWDHQKINVNLTKSLDEVKGDRLFRTNSLFSAWYHQYALTRIYPVATRVNSSNYNPVTFWNFGSQMVAMNFQKPDKYMQWNRGKFRQNGACGYVLKPDCLRVINQPQGRDSIKSIILRDGLWEANETLITIQVITSL